MLFFQSTSETSIQRMALLNVTLVEDGMKLVRCNVDIFRVGNTNQLDGMKIMQDLNAIHVM